MSSLLFVLVGWLDDCMSVCLFIAVVLGILVNWLSSGSYLAPQHTFSVYVMRVSLTFKANDHRAPRTLRRRGGAASFGRNHGARRVRELHISTRIYICVYLYAE